MVIKVNNHFIRYIYVKSHNCTKSITLKNYNEHSLEDSLAKEIFKIWTHTSCTTQYVGYGCETRHGERKAEESELGSVVETKSACNNIDYKKWG